ncbi:hypothetical protein Tco_0482040 [Tanacetum coccineum]
MASAAARPLVTVQTLSSDMKTDQPTTVPLPHVMKAQKESSNPVIKHFTAYQKRISKEQRHQRKHHSKQKKMLKVKGGQKK